MRGKRYPEEFKIEAVKQVTDRGYKVGEVAGDNFLKTIGERLQACPRESDTAVRIGGDEFAVILENLNNRQDAQKAQLNLRGCVEMAFTLEGVEIIPSISIGIALYPDDAGNADKLLKEADRAMFAEKLSKGKSR